VVALKDGPYTRKVVRDRHGRITGVEGRSRVDDLADVVAEVADNTEGLAERVEHLEGKPTAADAMAGVAEVVTETETRLARRVDDLVSAVGGVADQLAGKVERLEGWTEASGSELMLNKRALVEIGTRFGYNWRWPVTVRFHEPDESRSRRYAWLDNGDDGYVIHVFTGLGVEQTHRSISHELAHLAQIARIGNGYMKVYAECADELEAEADEMAATVTDIELVRAA